MVEPQVEQLEGHRARLTVKLDDETVERGRQSAARRIASEINIPGFRRGKAPHSVIAQYVGEEYLLQEAVEDVGQDVYRQALEAAGIEPYTIGEITDMNLEDGITLTFEVPMQPSVELNAYRDIRTDYEPPSVSDEDVDHVLMHQTEDFALTELASRPAQPGDEVLLSVNGVVDSPEADETAEEEPVSELAAAEDDTEDDDVETSATDDDAPSDAPDDDVDENFDEDDEDDEDEDEDVDKSFIDDSNLELILRADDPDHDVAPGFSNEIVGLSMGEEKSFSITIPEDTENEQLAAFAGATINFEVLVKEVRNLVLPVQDDFFAALITMGEQNTMEELRARIHKDMLEDRQQNADNEFANEMISLIAEQAEFTYPEAAVESYQEDLINELSETISQQIGLSIDQYLNLTGQTREQMKAENRDRAIQRMKNSLVITAIADAEGIEVDDDDVDAEIDKQLENFAEDRREGIRVLLESEMYREQIATNLVTDLTIKRLVAIGRGEAPPLEAKTDDDTETNEDASPSATAEDGAEDETRVVSATEAEVAETDDSASTEAEQS